MSSHTISFEKFRLLKPHKNIIQNTGMIHVLLGTVNGVKPFQNLSSNIKNKDFPIMCTSWDS